MPWGLTPSALGRFRPLVLSYDSIALITCQPQNINSSINSYFHLRIIIQPHRIGYLSDES